MADAPAPLSAEPSLVPAITVDEMPITSPEASIESAHSSKLSSIYAHRAEVFARELGISADENDDGDTPAALPIAATPKTEPQSDATPPAQEAVLTSPDAAPLPAVPATRPVVLNGQTYNLTDAEVANLVAGGLQYNQLAQQARQAQQPVPQQRAPQIAPVNRAPVPNFFDDGVAKDLGNRISFGNDAERVLAVQEMAGRMLNQFASIYGTPDHIAQYAAERAHQSTVAQLTGQQRFEHNLNTIGSEFPEVFADYGLSQLAGNAVNAIRQRDAQVGLARDDLTVYREAANFVKSNYALAGQSPAGAPGPAQLPISNPRVAISSRESRKSAAPQAPRALQQSAPPPPSTTTPKGSDVVSWLRQSRGQPN